jgi:hypothetical protein
MRRQPLSDTGIVRRISHDQLEQNAQDFLPFGVIFNHELIHDMPHNGFVIHRCPYINKV